MYHLPLFPNFQRFWLNEKRSLSLAFPPPFPSPNHARPYFRDVPGTLSFLKPLLLHVQHFIWLYLTEWLYHDLSGIWSYTVFRFSTKRDKTLLVPLTHSPRGHCYERNERNIYFLFCSNLWQTQQRINIVEYRRTSSTFSLGRLNNITLCFLTSIGPMNTIWSCDLVARNLM